MTPLEPALLDELRAAVGSPHVLTDAAAMSGYTRDWTGRFAGAAGAVVRPGSTEEVAAVVAACSRSRCAIVPQGGNTGLVGGGVPVSPAAAGGVVLSLRRLTDLTVDPAAGEVTAGAGVTIAQLRAAAERHPPWMYGIDLASRDSATVGGTIATNAGGLRVLRYGDTRAQLLGIEAVLGAGSVISHLGGLRRDNTGYHLPSLLCGSEGTLGIVTRVRLRLVPAPRRRTVALLAMPSVSAAAAAALAARRIVELEAAELMLQSGIALVCAAGGLPAPFRAEHPAYLLLEAAAEHDPTRALEQFVAELAVGDVAVAVEVTARRHLWAYREGHTEAINALGPPHKLDVTLPADAYPEFLATIADSVTHVRPQARVWLFGHAADGNVHVNITGLAADDEEADDVVMRRVAGMGGSISTEHGIGWAKRRWLALSRGSAELELFAGLKRACDPAGILNPGVMFDG